MIVTDKLKLSYINSILSFILMRQVKSLFVFLLDVYWCIFQVHFKVRFDAKDFSPEDIDVTTVGNRLTVHAKKTTKTNQSSSNREFSRTIDLPQSIDHEKFSCTMTEVRSFDFNDLYIGLIHFIVYRSFTSAGLIQLGNPAFRLHDNHWLICLSAFNLTNPTRQRLSASSPSSFARSMHDTRSSVL